MFLVIATIVAGLISFGGAIYFAKIIFGPLETAVLAGGRPRFQIVDLLSLCVLWQYGLGIAFAFDGGLNGDRDDGARIILGGSLILGATAVWYALAVRLSRLGVSSSIRRGVVFCVATPLGTAATLAFLIATLTLTVAAIDSDHSSSGVLIGSYLALASAIAVGAVCRLMINWALQPPVIVRDRA